MHFKPDMLIKLLLWSKLILWSCLKYKETTTKRDDFTSFQLNKDGKTPFILKMKDIAALF